MNEPLHIQAEIAKGNKCKCGHHGKEHAGTEPRVCKVISCDCYQFQVLNSYSILLSEIDRYIAQFNTWDERVTWLCQNMQFLLGLNNTQFIFWYWKYVYPKWNPEEEFLLDETKTAIEANAKPEAITRAFRLYKEYHPEEVEKFQNLRMWQRFNEAGYHEAAVLKKL